LTFWLTVASGDAFWRECKKAHGDQLLGRRAGHVAAFRRTEFVLVFISYQTMIKREFE